MKFGKELEKQKRFLGAPWGEALLDYKGLKKIIKDHVSRWQEGGSLTTATFRGALLEEMDKIDEFHGFLVSRLLEDTESLSRVHCKITSGPKTQVPSQEEWDTVLRLCNELNSFRKFLVLCYIGVRKIVKKLDKNSRVFDIPALSPMVLSNLYSRDFYKSHATARLNSTLEVISSEFFRRRMGGVGLSAAEWKCPICLDLVDTPVSLSCAHRFCWSCLETAHEHNLSNGECRGACPVCRKVASLHPAEHGVDLTLQAFLERNFLQIEESQPEQSCKPGFYDPATDPTIRKIQDEDDDLDFVKAPLDQSVVPSSRGRGFLSDPPPPLSTDSTHSDSSWYTDSGDSQMEPVSPLYAPPPLSLPPSSTMSIAKRASLTVRSACIHPLPVPQSIAMKIHKEQSVPYVQKRRSASSATAETVEKPAPRPCNTANTPALLHSLKNLPAVCQWLGAMLLLYIFAPSVSLSTLLLLFLPVCFAAKMAYDRFKLPKAYPCEQFAGRVFGHRGCRVKYIPENSMKSFKFALKNGAFGIELDTRLTKDKVPVVFHDCSVERMLKGEGRVEDMTLRELQSLPFVSHEPNGVPVGPAGHVPTLEDTLKFVTQHNLTMLMEIKELKDTATMADKVVELLLKYEALSKVVVISFNPVVLYQLRKREPRVRVGMLFDDQLLRDWVTSGDERLHWALEATHKLLDPVLAFAAEHVLPEFVGASMIGPHNEMLSKRKIEEYRSRGLLTYAWTVNSEVNKTWLGEQGVALGTDVF